MKSYILQYIMLMIVWEVLSSGICNCLGLDSVFSCKSFFSLLFFTLLCARLTVFYCEWVGK